VNHDRYALFVWPAYAITALVFAWMVIDTVLRAGVWRRRAERSEADDASQDRRP
jgi:heme exporter protein D